MDEEDVMECDCYIVFCMANDGRFFTDRVYRNKNLAEKRIDHLNKISGDRGKWFSTISELGN